MKFQVQTTTAICLISLFGSTACFKTKPKTTPHPAKPIAQDAQISVLDSDRPSASPLSPKTQAVQVHIEINTEAFLNQEFLYGADLQYSSAYDKKMDLYQQSLAIGHTPARFRISGDELQLIADNKHLYPSDVNHPEQLLTRFKILSRKEAIPATSSSPAQPATLTISGANSGLTLAQLCTGATKGAVEFKAPQDQWIRSFQYIPNGNYLLQETSIVLENGTIAEFMESIFPRKTLEPGKDFKKFALDPTDPAGASEGLIARFRLLPGEPVYEGEKHVAYAQHFDISKGPNGSDGTIDFYVTPNIPDEFLKPVQYAVEGWNRYFLKMKGIARKVVQFKGKLPSDIRLGDPRYNVINWDNRLVAGAAYESQSTDPTTGRQSHSLIYMPAAWFAIGEKYWSQGQYSDNTSREESVSPTALSKNKGAAYSAKLSCLRDVREAQLIFQSGRLSADEIKVFGIQMLIQTLFHEVGHALGLAHNFKGSLSYDRSKPNSIFSSSIMDYNDYELERQAFYSPETEDGPLLEYDRQILSAIYNNGNDISESDPVVPTCNDEEADQLAGGVDPLCIRYDLENDPTLSIVTAFNRIQMKTIERDVTLAQALSRASAKWLSNEEVEKIKSMEDFEDWKQNIVNSVLGSAQFYLMTSKASLSRVLNSNIRALYLFAEDILPPDYQEEAMRSRAFQGIKAAANFNQLPQTVYEAVQEMAEIAIAKLGRSPFLRSSEVEDQPKLLEDLQKTILGIPKKIESHPSRGLIALRATLFSNLKRNEKVPFFAGKISNGNSDYELAVATILHENLMKLSRTPQERIAAAQSLVTYKGRLSAVDQMIQDAVAKVTIERNSTIQNKDREATNSILKILMQPTK